MRYIITFLSVFHLISGYGQSTKDSILIRLEIAKIDSSLNVYERRYRDTLNKSDTIEISNLVNKIKKDCSQIDSILNRNIYSNYFIAELIRTTIDCKVCEEKIIDSITFFRPVEELVSSDNYPISLGITKSDSSLNHIVTYLFESNYLSNCRFIKSKKGNFLNKLSYLINKSKIPLNLTQVDCKSANLLILKSYFNDK